MNNTVGTLAPCYIGHSWASWAGLTRLSLQMCLGLFLLVVWSKGLVWSRVPLAALCLPANAQTCIQPCVPVARPWLALVSLLASG